MNRVRAVRSMLRERQRNLQAVYTSRGQQQQLKLTSDFEKEVQFHKKSVAGYRLAASNAKKKQVASDKRVTQVQERMRKQQSNHEEQVQEWVNEINDLQQQLEMAMAGVIQTVDPSLWKSELKDLHQSIRRLKENQKHLLVKKQEAETDLNTLRQNMVREGTIAREAAKLARRVRTLERLLKTKSSSVQRLRVRHHSHIHPLTPTLTHLSVNTTHSQNNLAAIKAKKSEPTDKIVMEKLKDRCIHFEELSDKLQEELDDANRQLNHKAIPRSLGELKARGKRRPFPLPFVLVCMELLGNGTMASRVSQNIKSVLRFAGHAFSDTELPHQTTLRKWRFSMAYICMAQVGHALTQAARNGERNLVLNSDGTPVKGFHVEGCIVTVNGKSLTLIPRVQGSKAATETSVSITTSVDECQGVYNDIYAAVMKQSQTMGITEPPRGLPKPVSLGSLLLLFRGSVSDHAAGEKAKVNCISKEKERRLVDHCNEWRDFGFTSKEEFERYASAALYVFFCSNHKNMLLSSTIREADHDCLLDTTAGLLPPQRDQDEFRTSNIIDMAQLQLSKMFNHTKLPYAFGHGVLKFPAWMAKKYQNFNRWVGLKRLVGNRAQIFLENALCMYHMATYYQVCLGLGFGFGG